MVTSCCAYGCTNRQTKGSSLTFHRFPAQKSLQKLWILAIRRKNYTPSKSSFVCSEHFRPDDFKTHTTRKCLKENSVPSLFRALPEHLQATEPEVKKRKVQVPEVQEEHAVSDVHHIMLDHSYSFPSSLPEAKLKCDKMQKLAYEMMAKEKTQKCKVQAALCNVTQLSNALEVLEQEKLSSLDVTSLASGRFSNIEVKLIKDLLSHRSKNAKYSGEVKDFAVTLFYYSPKAYEFLARFFMLPSSRSVRRFVGSSDCYPGFQTPAFEELQRPCGDKNCADSSVGVDAMSTEELIQINAELEKTFECIDLASSSSISDDVPATKA